MVDFLELEAMSAIWMAAKKGKMQLLIDYIRSDKPLTAVDRKYLADYLNGNYRRKKGRPRGGNAALNLSNVAVMVDYYKGHLEK